jgi:hypothetical protein
MGSAAPSLTRPGREAVRLAPRAPVAGAFGYDARGLLVAARNEWVGLTREYDALGHLLREIDTRFGSGVGSPGTGPPASPRRSTRAIPPFLRSTGIG